MGRGRAFGELLRSHRATAGLTQEMLAERAGLSLAAVSALERGIHVSPHTTTVALLADALGVTPGERDEMMLAAQPRNASTYTAAPRRDRRAAAWELYVELITRIAVADLGSGEGLLREALTSLHSLFPTTRALLRRHGRVVARPARFGLPSIRSVAIKALDDVLRPFLGKWHPLLLEYESQRPAGASVAQHERAWPRNGELREALVQVRAQLSECAKLLAAIAEIPDEDRDSPRR